MRKVRTVIAVLFIIFLFVGCDFSDPSDSKLVGLVVTATSSATVPLNPSFAPATLAYTASTSETIVYFAAELPRGATATYNGGITAAMSTGATNDVKDMTIVVTSKDGSTTTTYVITVTRTL